MEELQGVLKNDIVSNKIKNNSISKSEFELDFSDFEKLLDFDDIPSGGVAVSIQVSPLENEKSKEQIIPNKSDSDKVELTIETKNVEKIENHDNNSDLDFSMFDNLLKDFDNNIPKQVVTKKSTKKEKIDDLKDEIKYYQNKLDDKYNLENLEKYESKLFEIKNKLDDLRGYCSFSFLDYKFNSSTINEIIKALNSCSKELENLVVNDKIGKLNKKQTIDKIDMKIINNIEKQKNFLSIIKNEVINLNNNIVSKIYFCMVKRLMFNLYRLIVGMYKLENCKKNHLKLNTGIFLIINALIGMKKALTLDFSNDGYYYYKDYVSANMSAKDITMLTLDMMNKSSKMIDDIQKNMKANFSRYKDYYNDYEEVYFKLTKFKDLIENQSKECDELLNQMDSKNKKIVKNNENQR